RVGQLGWPLPAWCKRASRGKARTGVLVRGLQKAMATTTQLWPLAVATRFLVEATASRNQPSPQTHLPALWVKVSSTSRVTNPVNLRAVRINRPTRWARTEGAQAERSKKL